MACLLLIVAGLLVLHSRDKKAPPMSQAYATEFLQRGVTAFQRQDVDGVMALMSPKAKILDRTEEQLRPPINQAMKEVGSNNLTAKCTRVEAQQQGDRATVSFDLEIGQHTKNSDITFYRTRMHALLEKQRESHWMGLYSEEDWKITNLTSDSSLDVPQP
jgi:ketosteroid isomerase-like protein